MLWLCWSVFSCLNPRIWVSETIDKPTRLKTPVMIATQISTAHALMIWFLPTCSSMMIEMPGSDSPTSGPR